MCGGGDFISTFKKCKAPECQTEKIHIFMTHLMKHLEFAVIINCTAVYCPCQTFDQDCNKRGGGVAP